VTAVDAASGTPIAGATFTRKTVNHSAAPAAAAAAAALVVFVAADSTQQWWYSWVKVTAVDAASNTPIAGVTFTGTWSISPDNDG
jgi:hypothetical protein